MFYFICTVFCNYFESTFITPYISHNKLDLVIVGLDFKVEAVFLGKKELH